MKLLNIFLILIIMSLMSTYSIAGQSTNEDDPGTSITVDDGAATPNELTFNFSPSVSGIYITPTDSGNEQSWTAGTYHSGGTKFYGTASDQTIIYKKDRTTTQLFAQAGFPEVQEDDSVVGQADPWNVEGCTEDCWEKQFNVSNSLSLFDFIIKARQFDIAELFMCARVEGNMLCCCNIANI